MLIKVCFNSVGVAQNGTKLSTTKNQTKGLKYGIFTKRTC